MKRIILAIACLGLAGGVASADRFHGSRGGSHGGGSVTVRDHRGGCEWRGAREGGVRGNVGVRGGYHGTYNHGSYNYGHYNRPVYTSGYRHTYVRRPIYVSRPIIRQRYYDYRYRPQLIVENYPARDGYFWVAGQWTWNGYEWLWQPGHYEPDPNYTGYYYDGYQ